MLFREAPQTWRPPGGHNTDKCSMPSRFRYAMRSLKQQDLGQSSSARLLVFAHSVLNQLRPFSFLLDTFDSGSAPSLFLPLTHFFPFPIQFLHSHPQPPVPPSIPPALESNPSRPFPVWIRLGAGFTTWPPKSLNS